jgi:hypothetical protein
MSRMNASLYGVIGVGQLPSENEEINLLFNQACGDFKYSLRHYSPVQS